MEFYKVLERRRTIRDFSDRIIPDEVLNRVIGAVFKAPTNDHLRQFEFVVVRDREQIVRLVSPVAGNTEAMQQPSLEMAKKAGADEDEVAMFIDALPKQQRMLTESGCLVLLFFRHVGAPITNCGEQQGLNYFASAWVAVENMLLAATAEGLACAFRIPIGNESEHVKAAVGVPEGYEFPCFLAIGYPADNAHICKQKTINPASRIHLDRW